MAKFEIGPLEEYVDMLSNLEKKTTQNIIKVSIFNGANIVADEIKKEIEKLPIDKSPLKGITKKEKNDLIKGFGIAPLQIKDGNYDVKIGFDGYGHKTKKYPQGIPIPMLARSIISGTSFRNANNFVKRATNRVKKKTIETMNKTIDEEIKKEMK